MTILETERLRLRELTAADAEFLFRLMNDEAWLRFIGDRGIRTVGDAAAYVESGPRTMYATHGIGLWAAEMRDTNAPIGMCGLLKRDALDDVDIGFALLPEFRGGGYAFEAAKATLEYANAALGLGRVAAIVSPDNAASIGLLVKLGMSFERMVRLKSDAPEVALYVKDCGGPRS